MLRSVISLRSLFLSAILLAQLILATCAEHNTYHVYDGYYHDHHDWDDREQTSYFQWENETHRDHREFMKRDSDEQNDYWKWRHNHEDKDHNHNNH